MNLRKVTTFVLGVTAIFVAFRLVEWQFGARAHVYTLLVVMISIGALNFWFNRRSAPTRD